MLNAQDEDYEKRLERARQLRNSVGMVTNNDKMQQSTNNNNMSLSNGMDYEQKLQRAKKLRNSIGMITSRDIQNTDISKKSNITNFPNIDNNSNISITTDEAENKAKNNDVFSEQKKENKTISIQKPKEVKTDINTDITVNKTNIPLRERETKNTLKTNTPISIASNVSNQTKVTSKDVKAMNEAEERNKQIEKGGIDAFNATAETILKNIQGGAMSTSAGLANVATTAAALGVKGLESWAHVIGQNKAANSLNDLYNNIVEAGSNIKSTGEYQSNITGRIENEAVRTAGQVTNTVSEMATNALIGYVLPGGGKLSTAIQGLSVGGRSAQEVLDENPDKIKQATLTGLAKGYTSYLTEKMFDANILTKGQGGSISDKVDELVFKNIKSKFGKEFANKTIGIIGENIEELAEDNIGNIIDKLVNDKDFPTIQEWWNNTAETAKVTTLSTIVMSLLGLGGGSFENKESDIMTRKVQKIIDDGGYAIQYNKDEVVNNSNKGTFYTTTFNQEGEVESINTVQGKPIENPNKKVNVTPAIILNNETNTYNVIDSNTGVLLDTTPYSTLIQAQTEFTSKMINLDEATIKGINSKVSQSNIAINNKINEVITQAENELNNTSQNVSNGSIATSNDNTSNYTSINQKDVTGQNNVNLSLTMEQRTNENVSNQNINSYQFEHPEVREEIQGMASMFLDDLSNSTFGERYKIGDTWSGQKRSTTKQLAQIKDETKATWNQISQALTDISEGKGNYALAKKIELILDDALTNGYTNIYGKAVVPNESYLTKKETIEGINYRNANTANNTFLDEEDYRIFGLKKKTNSSQNNQNTNINNLSKKTMDHINNNQKFIIRQNSTLSDNEIRNIVKYNQDGREIKDSNYIDFMVKRFKDNKNISGIETNTEYIESIEEKTKKEKIDLLYNQIEDKSFKIDKRLYDENGTLQTIQLDLMITKTGVLESFNKGYSNEKYAIVPYLDKLIKTSRDGIIREESKNRENINEWYYIYNSAKINEKLYGIKIDIKKTQQGDRFYVHRVNIIKNEGNFNSMRTPLEMEKSKNKHPSIDNSISQRSNFVKNTITDNNSIQKIETIYRKFSRDFHEKGYINLNNKKISNIQEVADIAQVFRNPKYETFRILYVKGNMIVGQESISSRIPGKTKVFDDNNKNKSFYKIKNRMQRLNADGYYMIHNHPTGKAIVSKADIDTTHEFVKNISGFQGHIIVNSGTYGTITINPYNLSSLDVENELKIPNYNQDEIDKMMSDAPWSKMQVNSNKQIATLMHDVKNNPDYSTLILADSKLYPRIVLDIPNNFFNMQTKQIDGYIKNIAKQNGAVRAFIATTNSDVYESSSKLTTITDSILYSIKDNEIYENNTISKNNSEIAKQTIFNDSDLKTKKNKTEDGFENNDDIRYMKKASKPKTNIMNNYDDITANRIKMNTRNVIVENNEQLANLINEALSTNENKALHLGKLDQNIVENIKNNIKNLPQNKQNLLSKDTYDLVVNQSEIRHLVDSKSSLTNADIQHFIKILPEIVSDSDYIAYTNNLKDEGIRFKKLMNDGTYVSFVIVSNKQGTMKVKTIYMEKSDYQNKKRSISLTTDVNKTPDNTSKTNRAFASNTSIHQNTENVKNDIKLAKKVGDIEQGLTNAERADSWVEQEIQKIEKNGNWDDSIPITKRSDIRKTIEDYLGLGIKKGKFRQQAYGIYKSNRDVIRTKELKDMDTILHETGHALDLGNRLNIDKESIADELLTAIDKLGGYENESRTVKLDEGFAEVIREYAIIPEQAKIDYPQTIAVLENIKKNDVSFNNFITKVQQQTYNYIHQNPRNRVLSNQSIGEQTDKQKWSKAWIEQEVMRNIYDKDYALKKAVNTLAEIGGKTSTSVKASNNAYLLTRLSSGIGQKVTSMLSNGYIDTHGNKLMPGLNQIGEILGNNPERYNDLRAYLVAQRDLEYKAKTLKTGIRTMDSKAVVEQFRNDTEIQQAAKIVYDTLDGVLQYAVDNRLITQENADALRESNAFYVPMHRVLENRGNQVGKRGAVVDIIKKRTGSELDVKDVLENIIVNSSNIIQQVENNNILKALYNQGEAIGLTGAIYDVISTPMQKVGQAQLAMWENELRDQGIDTRNIDFNKTVDIFAPNNKTDMQNKTTSFINDDGKRVYLQFNDELIFNSIMNMDKKFMSQVLKINSKLNMPLRYGATMANIGFAIPNMISDTAQAAIYSTAGFIPVIDNALGVLDVLAATNSKVRNFVNNVAPEYAKRINTLYALYEQSGAMSSTRLSQYRESSQNIMKDVYGTKNSEVLGIDEKFKPLKRLLDLMTYIPELSEQSTRFRVFERNYDYYKNKGTSETDTRIMAAIESRDATQDFGRTGNFTREINQLIPFSAARVGSIYTFTEKVKSNPKQVGMRIAILTAIAMAIKGMGYDDKEIEELNQRKKDDNFVLKLGDSVVTIKKPQGILRSIVNLAEYIQDLATGHIDQGKEGERLGEWINNAIMDNMPADSLPGLVPNSLAPLIENAVNKDFYYNTDIVKSYDLDLPDSQQYYDYNSQLAILLGKIFNYSPAKIDNLISGYFGGLGTQTTNILDYISGKLGLSAEKPEMGVEQNAVGKRFIVNVNTNSASIDEIYNRKTELTKKKNGGTITENETKELERLTEAVSNISNINKQIRSIKSDLSTSGEEKSDLIRPLQEQKTDTARKALGKEIIHSENITKIESTKFYPSRNTLSQNGYTLNLTEEMKKEYETLAYSNYQKYEKHGLYSKEKLKELESRCKNYAKGKLMQKYKSKLVKLK